MYKVPQEILKNCKDSLHALSILLTMSSGGKKLNIKQLNKEFDKANNLIKLLENNYEC
tara:strand:- start:1406 stop:1579 length:174 start_codon:yes stop_codon:yes gene_type:complete